MGEVLIDNWNLSKMRLIENNNKYIPNDAYSNLLSAIVLWDNIYYLDEKPFVFSGLVESNILSLLKPLHMDQKIKRIFEKSSKKEYKKNYSYRYNDVIAERALYYHEISKAFNLDYYPESRRADFLNHVIGKYELWSRNEVIKEEEKEILRRIQEFNMENDSIISIPLLSNLIIKNSDQDFTNTALDIKNTKEVIRFRKYMDKVDEEINLGNFEEAKSILKLIPYIIDDIEKMDRKIDITAKIKIKLTPMTVSMITGTILSNAYTENELLNMGFVFLTIGQLFQESKIEINKDLLYRIYPKKIQLNFLRTLAKNYLDK